MRGNDGKLEKALNKLGLHREVEHREIDDNARAGHVTVVRLYHQKDWEMYKSSKEGREKLTPLVEAHAYCSWKDNFCRREGRTTATARAIQAFVRHEANCPLRVYPGYIEGKDQDKWILVTEIVKGAWEKRKKEQEGEGDGK